MSQITEQYVSEADLNVIKGLVHYLNSNLPEIEGLSAEVRLTDSNGEHVGTIRTPTGEGSVGAGYAFHFLIREDYS